jgi:predicted lysophospholipase L1 biosynthesis ABC-type transport system permease subunit
MGERLIRIFVRISGPLPPRGAVRADKLAWTRRLYLRVLLMMVLVYALVAIIGAPRWLWAVLIVGAGAWLCGFTQVNLQLWRERRRSPGSAA